MLGAVAGCPITATFDGDASLRKRPMRRVLDPLERIGARTARLDRRPPAADARRRARSDPDRVPAAGAVGAIEVGGAARRPCRAGRNRRDRSRGDARSHREDADPFRRRRCGSSRRATHGRRITLTGQPELVPAPVVVPADPSSAAFPLVAGADRAGLGRDPRRRDDQSAAHRAAHHACARWAPRSSGSTCATKAARTSPICACAPARCAASRCRPSARRR